MISSIVGNQKLIFAKNRECNDRVARLNLNVELLSGPAENMAPLIPVHYELEILLIGID